jgi:hypothetical protein
MEAPLQAYLKEEHIPGESREFGRAGDLSNPWEPREARQTTPGIPEEPSTTSAKRFICGVPEKG